MEPFADILTRADNPMGIAIILVLSWIASCDGQIANEELEGLRSIAATERSRTELSAVIDIARAGSIDDLQLACQVLRELNYDQRRLMLQMAIGMALEDGYLTTTEGHIIRLIADLFFQSPAAVNALFREMTGVDFPSAADPSSIGWWEAREAKSGRRASSSANSSQSTQPGPAPSAPDMQRLRDLAILGLDDGADAGMIRDAYRRMAMVHHPDRFATLGPEAVKSAEISFRRIHGAYERLGAR